MQHPCFELKTAKLPIFAWLRFSECVPQFIPCLSRENILSFSKWWQLSRHYKSCESCPGDHAKKVKHLSSPPHPGLKFANKTDQILRFAGIHPQGQGQCIIDRQIPQSTFKVDRNQECAIEQFFVNVRGLLSDLSS